MKLKKIEICFVMLVLIRSRFAQDVWSIICLVLHDKIAEEKSIQHIIAFEVMIKVLWSVLIARTMYHIFSDGPVSRFLQKNEHQDRRITNC